MAHVYFRKAKSFDGSYWSLDRVVLEDGDPRTRLELILREYRIVCGDIGESEERKRKALATLRRQLKEDGCTLYFISIHTPFRGRHHPSGGQPEYKPEPLDVKGAGSDHQSRGVQAMSRQADSNRARKSKKSAAPKPDKREGLVDAVKAAIIRISRIYPTSFALHEEALDRLARSVVETVENWDGKPCGGEPPMASQAPDRQSVDRNALKVLCQCAAALCRKSDPERIEATRQALKRMEDDRTSTTVA